MKRLWFLAPFVALTGTHVASHWADEGHLIGDIWIVALFACLLCVPPLSRWKLWVGYVALLYPFALLAVHLALDWGPLSVGLP